MSETNKRGLKNKHLNSIMLSIMSIGGDKMIYEDTITVVKSWKIYSAEQFKEEFNIKEEWSCGEQESDEEFIMRHLEADNKYFRITFFDNKNPYEEYWLIEEVSN